MKKERLDALLTARGLFESRARAQAAIMAGQVLVNEQKIDKPGTQVPEEAAIRLLGEKLKYVSRGGLKLEKALQIFPISVEGKTVADIGASTGGFSDCALQNGAVKVYAVDVGYGQLDWKLRNDSRVVCMERTNFRYIDTNLFENENVNFASIDVSFISLKIILPVLVKIISKEQFDIIALIKPQFEAGREEVKKNGVVKEASVHKRVIQEILMFAQGIGLEAQNLAYSPITGPKGNIEFLVHFNANCENNKDIDIDDVVGMAHNQLL